MAEALEMSPPDIADLKTIVTEACMNVVVHAYGDEEPGPLEVEAEEQDGCLVVTVRDYGQGIRPLADVERRSLRLGLPLIAALTESFEISCGALRQGTEVVMRVPISSNGAGPTPETPPAGDETRISAPAGALLGPILSRVISMFAARANFSVDRLSDAVLLSDAISAHGPDRFPGGTAQISISEDDGAFELRVGPLDEGGGRRLIEGMRIPELNATLEGLADEVAVEPADDGERLLIRIAQAKP
jgi:serine/threonine-protein kinase RsbW